MARIAGRSGRLYAGISSGGVAEPIAYIKSWSLDFSTNKIKVTAMGDSNEVYVGGLPDAQGQVSGFYDNATPQLYTAAIDGVARKWYLYADNSLNTQYWFGTGIFDFNVNADVDGAVEIASSFAASSVASKVG